LRFFKFYFTLIEKKEKKEDFNRLFFKIK
jgi:hypothetical protein